MKPLRRLFLIALIPLLLCPAGCGGSPEGGTAAKFSPESDKSRQDSMREYMQKQKNGIPGQGVKSKK